MDILDEHGNYGAVVRFTKVEWEAFQKFADGIDGGDSDE